MLDSAGIPAVGGVDALLIAIAVREPRLAYLAALFALAGSLIGCMFLFLLARKGGEVFLAKYIASPNGARLHKLFEQYGLVTVFIPALSPIPMPMKIPVFCAGALEVRTPYFVGVVLAARIIRYFSLAYLGQRYGSQTFSFLKAHWVVVAAVAGVLAILAVVILRLVRKKEPADELAAA
jgi:membrane protein YqaA with SNARE-associated domain